MQPPRSTLGTSESPSGKRGDWEQLLNLARARNLPFFVHPFRRFGHLPEGHDTFVLRDPSNNLLEFKCYDNSQMIY
jgi:hypothetical protein